MRDALVVDSTAGQRWELALDLLRVGTGHVRIGSLEFSRRPFAPGEDERVNVSIDAVGREHRHPGAERAVERGLDELDRLRSESSELDRLLDDYGVLIEYVNDYGDGAATLGQVEGRELRWHGE